MNRQQTRAADKAASRAPPAPQRSTGNPRAAFTLIRSIKARSSTESLDKAQLLDLALGYHGALSSLMSGTGTADDCQTLAYASNVAQILCEKGLGADELPGVQAAQEAIFMVHHRSKSSGRFVMTGAEIRALQFLVDFHDAQLGQPDLTEGNIAWAQAHIRTRIAQGNVLEVAT